MNVPVTSVHVLIGNQVFHHLASHVSRFEGYGLDHSLLGSERCDPGEWIGVPEGQFFHVDLLDLEKLPEACRGMDAMILLLAGLQPAYRLLGYALQD